METNSSLNHETPPAAKPLLVAGLSLIQAKGAAMIEGKKVRHRFFMDDEYIYYKSGCWFTQDGYQISDSYWVNAQKIEWNDGWSVVL
jgi:hypothetical protein